MARHGRWSADQRAIFRRIEDRRAALQADQRRIEVLDFGAGPMEARAEKDHSSGGVRRQLTVARVTANSKPAPWAQFIHQLVRAVGARSCLEMGSCVGLTAAYIAAAFNGDACGLVTLEGADSIAKLAEDTLKGVGLSERAEVVVGPFHDTLDDTLRRGTYDLVFVDGHHDRDSTIDYWHRIRPRLSPSAIVLFDDIRWSAGMEEAWSKIVSDPNLSWSLDLDSVGIVRPAH